MICGWPRVAHEVNELEKSLRRESSGTTDLDSAWEWWPDGSQVENPLLSKIGIDMLSMTERRSEASQGQKQTLVKDGEDCGSRQLRHFSVWHFFFTKEDLCEDIWV